MKASSGQSGPPLALMVDDLNKDELRICEAVWEAGRELSIDQLARGVFKLKPTAAKAKSRVRNGVRRPVRASLLARGSRRGKYAPGSRAPAAYASKTKAPPPSNEASPTSPITFQQIEQRVRDLEGQVPTDSIPRTENAQKLALVLAATEALGPRDSMIARVTGISRGSVIRRLKLLNGRIPGAPNPGFWTAQSFWDAVRQFASS